MSNHGVLKFTNLNVGILQSYINRAKLNSDDNTMVLDLFKNKIISKGHPPSKQYIRYLDIDTELVMGIDEWPLPDDQPILIPLINFGILLKTLGIFEMTSSDTISGEISYHKIDNIFKGVTTDHIYIANSVLLKGKKFKRRIPCAEPSMVSYLSQSVWGMLKSTEGSVIKFDMEPDHINIINKMLKLDSNDHFIMCLNREGANTTIKFNSESKGGYSLTHDGNIITTPQGLDEGKLEILIPKTNWVNMLSDNIYEIYLVTSGKGSVRIISIRKDDPSDCLINSSLIKTD
jgi:hypothetical protein